MLNSVVAPNVPTSNRSAQLAHSGIDADAPDTQRPGPSRTPPARLFNAATPPLQAPRSACPREAALVGALKCSTADEAPTLLKLLKERLENAATPEERDTALRRYEKALADRSASMAFPSDLLLNMANAGMDRVFWRTLGGTTPGIGAALALLQLARSAAHRSWSEVAPLVPTLVAMLPSLRNVEAIDAWIQSMPATLREQLEHLHQWVEQTDDALTPDLPLQNLGPALAVAAVLWQVKSRLPSPSGQLQGVADLIANLPKHWQKLASLDRIGGALLAAPVGPNALSVVGEAARLDTKRKTPEEKAARVAHQRMFDAQFGPNSNRTVVPPFDTTPFDAKPPPSTRDTPTDFEAARAPGQPQHGSDVADPPVTEAEVATSGIGSMVSSWWTWLTGGTVAFSQLAQTEVGSELVAMVPGAAGKYGVPLEDVSVQTPLVETLAPSVSGVIAGNGNSLIKRNPLAAASALLFSVATAAAGAAYYLWPSPPKSLSTTDLAEKLAGQTVTVGDAWGTGLDLLLGVPELEPRTRRKRDASDNQSGRTTGAPSTGETGQLGLSPSQQDALLADNGLKNHLLSLQTWSLAVAQDLATQAGWQWVAQLPPSEQELLVSQLHALRKLLPVLESLQVQPQTLLDQALVTAGWSGDSTVITVDLGSTQVAGVTVRQQMPLLEYCLLRADGKAPQATFLHEGQTLPEGEQQTLLDFLGGSACAELGDAVRTHAESIRPTLVDAIKARLVIDAVKAKWEGSLGGGDTYLRGAEIVLGYLQGKADVESSALTYSDTLGDGTQVTFTVPNYLVLRSASSDRSVHGQVVLYRADLATFQSFDSESAFRQFLDAQRAAAGLHVNNGAIDLNLMQDIVAAAPPAYRNQLQDRVSKWEQGQTLFQSGKHGPTAWNAADSFLFDFKPCTEAQHTLDDWAGALITHGQIRQEQQLTYNRLRWSPLGLAHVATDEAFNYGMEHDLQSLQGHAHAAVQAGLEDALRRAGYGDTLKGIDPDHLQLTLNGQTMSLTAWATSGWQQHPLPKPVLPLNIGDVPGEGIGVPVDPQPLSPWPDSSALFDMDFIVYRVDAAGVRTRDEASTEQLQEEDARRAICNLLAEFADSNALGDAYTDHLKALANNPKSAFHTAIANQIRVHTAWMIELAYQDGKLDKATYTALMAEHAALDPAKGRPSALKSVTLKGHPINGIWALKAKGTHFVFLPGTASGDQLLDEKAFARWLKEPESETYMLAHAALRYHADLEAMFRKKESGKGVVLLFDKTRGPKHVAGKYIGARIADVDEMTVSQLERFNDAMVMVGSVAAALSCTFATAGAAAAVCASSTLALVGDAIARGADFLERGDIDGAIEQIASGVADAVDVMNLANIPLLLFQLGRRGLSTVSDATQALHHWQRQARGFAPGGRMSAGFATPRQQLSDTGLPMLEQPLTDGGTLYHQGGRDYIQQDGQFVESYVADGETGRRLRMPDEPDAVGPPVEYTDGQWQRPKQSLDGKDVTTPRTVGGRGATTPLPPKQAHPWIEKVPDAELLPPEKLDEIEAVFGIRRPGISPSPDLRQKVQELAMESRIQQIILNPDTLGNPGDEAIIMRAWADSPVLGNGKSVETYTQGLGEWTRGARFGKGPVGVMVEVSEPKQLPTLQQLIDASDIDALLQRLGLPQDTSNETLFATVKAELVATIGKDPAQSLLSWTRWMNAQHRLPTAADNLIKHFPALTKREAEALAASDPWLAHQALSWIFPDSTSRQVADILAQRTQRKTRESILEGEFNSPSKLQELSSHLQKVLPDRSWRVTSDPSGQGNVLSFTRPDEKENVVRKLTFSNNGQVSRPTTLGGSEPVSTWQQGIYDQLSPTGQQDLPGSYALRDRVVENMKDTPLATVCTVVRKPGQKVKRSPDCDPDTSISISPEDVQTRDDLGRQMEQVRKSMSEKSVQLGLEEKEYKRLLTLMAELRKKKEKLDPESQNRLRELEQRRFRDGRGVDTMNFASYQISDLTYNGKPLVLPETFPLQKTATSGDARPDLGLDDLLDGAPVRYVFLPEAQAQGHATFSSMFPDTYALGGDLTPLFGRYAEPGQGSKKITLTETDLLVTKKRVPLYTLSDEEIEQLNEWDYSEKIKQVVGDAPLWTQNAKTLRPGDYRVYQIRSCSEGKIIDGFFKAVTDSVDGLAHLWSANPGAVPQIKGRMIIVSEMDPCPRSCDPRLTRMKNEVFTGMDIDIFFIFDNNLHRKQWWYDHSVDAVVTRNRNRWNMEDMGEEEMRALAATELKKPEVKQWVEDYLKQHPPQTPTPRLWVPQQQIEF